MNVSAYTFGNPINTDSIINNELITDFDIKNFPFPLSFENDMTKIEIALDKNEKIFGLSETVGWLNKRGSIIRTYNTDDPYHTPDKTALYSSIPFYFNDKKKAFLIDFASEIIFDIGNFNKEKLMITITDVNFSIYIWESENYNDLISIYLKLTGKSYLPPKWAFGYQQSRWSYPDDKSVTTLTEHLGKYDFPCDAIYLDIDYMENYKVFTINTTRFSDLRNLSAKLKRKGIKLIPIIDPGVKIEPGYEVYEQGIMNNYFCTRNRKPMIANVWPGEVHFPDFYQDKIRSWWGSLYKNLVDCGIEGFWNDMNEPSIFFTPEKLKELDLDIEQLYTDRTKWRFDQLKNKVNSLQNSLADYKLMMQKDDENNEISHHKIHNLYGKQMTQAAFEGLEKIDPNRRFLLFSRSSYIGSQQFGGVWTGDNHSWWEHLRLNIQMVLSLNFAGIIYSGADIGGFCGNSNAELLCRWIQLGLFFPLFRNHSIIYSRQQEPWAFDDETTSNLRELIKLRYRLIPFLYSEFLKSQQNNHSYVKPLFFEYDQEEIYAIEDEFLIGNLLIAPIINPNQKFRSVYLPQDIKTNFWLEVDLLHNAHQLHSTKINYIKMDYDELKVFIKENSAIILGEDLQYVGERRQAKLQFLGLISSEINFEYLNDDGITKNSEYEKILISIKLINDKLEFNITREGNYQEVEFIDFKVFDCSGNIYKKLIDVS